MTFMRLSVTAAILASAVAATGCDQKTFTAINSTLANASKGASMLKNTQLPAAAIAASLGGLELVKALTSDSKALVSQGGGNVVSQGAGNLTGGNGIVAQGSGNFTGAPMFGLMADETKETKIDNKDTKVQMTVKYTSSKEGDTQVSSITSLTGKVNGYEINATGTFKYTPGATIGSVDCSMNGDIKYKELALKIAKLTFMTSDPIPTNSDNLGSFRFEQTEDGKLKYALDAKLSIVDKKIKATGETTGPDGTKEPLTLDEGNPTGVTADGNGGAELSN